MIDITHQDVDEFRELHRKHTGEELSAEEARACALSLIRLVAFAMQTERPAPPKPDNGGPSTAPPNSP